MSRINVSKPEGSSATPVLTLEPVNPGREREFLTLVRQSRQYHWPWVRPPSTRSAYQDYIARLSQPTHAGYFLCDSEQRLAGVININEIVRGAMCSGALGYYAFASSQGAGYMTYGLALVLQKAFTRHGLHRVEANVQPENERSLRLLGRLGFRFEGVAKRLLKVEGEWRDHERWALTIEEWRERIGERRPQRRASLTQGATFRMGS